MQSVLPKHKYHHFGPYLAEMDVDPDYCARLLKLGKKLKTSFRSKLAGQIEHEYVYPIGKEPWIFDGLKVYINTWIEGFKVFKDPNLNPQYKLNTMWINKMKAKEYNPVHIHYKCDVSFVLWLQVPQQMLNESKKQATGGSPPGSISFMYGEDKWSVINEQTFIPKVYTMVMFPSDLRHSVMHFESKVTRISASGNIKFSP